MFTETIPRDVVLPYWAVGMSPLVLARECGEESAHAVSEIRHILAGPSFGEPIDMLGADSARAYAVRAVRMWRIVDGLNRGLFD